MPSANAESHETSLDQPKLDGPAAMRSGSAWFIGLATGLAALLLYVLTLAPGAEWQDSGFHQYRILIGQLENPFGLALSHPLHFWIGRLVLPIPVGDPLWRINLISAVAGALAVGLLGALVTRLTHKPMAGVFAALALMLAHIFWQMSVVTETYTLSAAMIILEWHCLLSFARSRHPGWLALAFLVNGVHIADHLIGLLMLAPLGVLLLERVFRRRISAVWLVTCAMLWLAAASPYWTLVLQHWQRTGDLGRTVFSALFGVGIGGTGYAKYALNFRPSAAQLVRALLQLGYVFPSLALPIAIAGAWLARRRLPRDVFLPTVAAQSVLIFLFVIRYTIADQITFYVPLAVVVALWFGVGLGWLLDLRFTRTRKRIVIAILVVNALLPIGVYLVVPPIAERYKLLDGLTKVPYRNVYHYVLIPWRSGSDEVDRLADAVANDAGPGGWYLGAVTTVYPLAAMQKAIPWPHQDPAALAREQALADVTLFSFERNLTDPGAPDLTIPTLRAFLAHGGSVVVDPHSETERVWGVAGKLDKSHPLWRMTPDGGDAD